MKIDLLRPVLAASTLLALAACAAPDEYGPTASYPSGTLLTAPAATVVYPSGTTVYYPQATAALPQRPTDPSAYDATRRNSQSVGAGLTRMGNSVPIENGSP